MNKHRYHKFNSLAAAIGLALAASCDLMADPLVGPGSSYTSIFSPSGSATVDTPDGGLLSLSLGGSVGPTAIGLWDVQAAGGASVSLVGLGLLETGSQVALTGSSLQFNVSNNDSSLLGFLGTGTSIASSWGATATFNTPGLELTLAPNTRYDLSFDVDGHNGLLETGLGINPNFNVQLLDGNGNALNSTSSGTLISIAGLLGSGVTSGTVNLSFVTDSSVASGPIGVKFGGDANLNTTALGLGTNFATVSNLSLSATPVPEPSGAGLIFVTGVCLALRRRGRGR